jgi:hypothetical protein
MAKGVSFQSRENTLLFAHQYLVISATVFIIIILLLVHFVWDNPTFVFNRMLSNTLSTASYTKTITLSQNNQSSKQVITVETGAVNRVAETQTLSVPFYPKGAIKISSIGTPTTDYSKYIQLDTLARDKAGHLISYSPAIGLWGKTSPAGNKLTEGQLFNAAVLDVVPMANVNPVLKGKMLSYIKKNKVYSFSGVVKSETVKGRSELVYNVTLNLHYLQNYLSQLGEAIGLNQYTSKSTNVSDLPLNDTERLQFSIDVLSGQLAAIKFLGTSENYIYSSYGASPQISLPTKSISLGSLEKYIQSLSTK